MIDVDGSNLPADLQSVLGWLGLRVGGRPALNLHSANETDELSQWLSHDDSTTNIFVGIIRSHHNVG